MEIMDFIHGSLSMKIVFNKNKNNVKYFIMTAWYLKYVHYVTVRIKCLHLLTIWIHFLAVACFLSFFMITYLVVVKEIYKKIIEEKYFCSLEWIGIILCDA